MYMAGSIEMLMLDQYSIMFIREEGPYSFIIILLLSTLRWQGKSRGVKADNIPTL